mgnify:CR=1 FL=1
MTILPTDTTITPTTATTILAIITMVTMAIVRVTDPIPPTEAMAPAIADTAMVPEALPIHTEAVVTAVVATVAAMEVAVTVEEVTAVATNTNPRPPT